LRYISSTRTSKAVLYHKCEEETQDTCIK